MNKNDTEQFAIFVSALRLSFDGCSVKARIYYYAGRFIFVVRIIHVASSGNAPLLMRQLFVNIVYMYIQI